MARDFLYQDYIQQPAAPVHNDQRWLDWSIQLLLQTKEIIPGLKAKIRLTAPYRRSSVVELQYFNKYGGITTGVSLSENPIVNFTGLLGNRFVSIGSGISIDPKAGTLANCHAGLRFNSSILDASLTLTDMGQSLHASSCLSMNYFLKQSAFTVEMTHGFLSKQTSITLGNRIPLNHSMLIETRVGIDGTVGCLLEKELLRLFIVSIEGETNLKHAWRSAKIGLNCALKYKMR